MSPFESSDVLSVAFSQNFDFYQLNVVAAVDDDAAAAAVVQFSVCNSKKQQQIAFAIAKFEAAYVWSMMAIDLTAPWSLFRLDW